MKKKNVVQRFFKITQHQWQKKEYREQHFEQASRHKGKTGLFFKAFVHEHQSQVYPESDQRMKKIDEPDVVIQIQVQHKVKDQIV